jgi:hypothetical protein
MKNRYLAGAVAALLSRCRHTSPYDTSSRRPPAARIVYQGYPRWSVTLIGGYWMWTGSGTMGPPALGSDAPG